MSISRRQLIAAGGVATGVSAVQGWATPAGASIPVHDAINVKVAYENAPAAAGDGSADDTNAIQQHLNLAAGGGTVYLPVGTYKVTSTITVPVGASLVGGGNAQLGGTPHHASGHPGAATLLAAFSDTILKTPSASGTSVWSHIVNVRVAGTDALATTPSVLFDQGGFIRVEHCAFWRRGRECVQWKGGGAFVDNRIYGHHPTMDCIGLHFQGTDATVSGNVISARSHCLKVAGGANIIAQNLVYNSNTGAGIWVTSVRNTFIGNRLDENAGPGILVQGNSNVITGNSIYLNGALATYSGKRVGVHVSWGQGNAITGNTFGNWCHGSICNTQQHGVALTGTCDNNAVTGNTFFEQAVGGVDNTSTGTGNVISGNAGQA